MWRKKNCVIIFKFAIGLVHSDKVVFDIFCIIATLYNVKSWAILSNRLPQKFGNVCFMNCFLVFCYYFHTIYCIITWTKYYWQDFWKYFRFCFCFHISQYINRASISQMIWCKLLAPYYEKHPHTIMEPSPCFTVFVVCLSSNVPPTFLYILYHFIFIQPIKYIRSLISELAASGFFSYFTNNERICADSCDSFATTAWQVCDFLCCFELFAYLYGSCFKTFTITYTFFTIQINQSFRSEVRFLFVQPLCQCTLLK